MRNVYGPFAPDSDARRIRHENDARGMRTCWHCLVAYRSLRVVRGGRMTWPGQGGRFCSWNHYVEFERETARLRRHLAELEAA